MYVPSLPSRVARVQCILCKLMELTTSCLVNLSKVLWSWWVTYLLSVPVLRVPAPEQTSVTLPRLPIAHYLTSEIKHIHVQQLTIKRDNKEIKICNHRVYSKGLNWRWAAHGKIPMVWTDLEKEEIGGRCVKIWSKTQALKIEQTRPNRKKEKGHSKKEKGV